MVKEQRECDLFHRMRYNKSYGLGKNFGKNFDVVTWHREKIFSAKHSKSMTKKYYAVIQPLKAKEEVGQP